MGGLKQRLLLRELQHTWLTETDMGLVSILMGYPTNAHGDSHRKFAQSCVPNAVTPPSEKKSENISKEN